MKFEQEYKKLNPQQKKAVDTIEGPVMVVAGPGTGKTQILTLRIANILKKTDVGPSAILALTFTESGVASMRRRLVEMTGGQAYSVVISTFHGFCNDIIKNYPEEFPRIIGSQNITEVNQINIIEEGILKLPLKDLRPFGDNFYYVRDILKAINDLKREGVSPEEFENLVAREMDNFNAIEDLYHEKGQWKGKMKGDYQKLLKQISKQTELVSVYKYYQEQLASAKLYDYSDMIMEVLRELKKNSDLLLTLQEQHQYILVDEHQDTNNAQNKIMELLCNFHDNPNIFVVGDEKQAIFRFQGASLENFMYFKKLYPKAELIVLEENYRSTQTILDSAHSILAGQKQLKANAGHPEKNISLYTFSKPEVETYFVAQDIKKKISGGTKAEEIAILYRDNRDAFPFVQMFEKIGIPFVVESDQDIMADHDIRKLILLLRTVNEFGSQERLLESMHIDFLGIHPLDIYKIIELSNRTHVPAFDIVKNKKLLAESGLESADKISDFYFKLSGWATISKNQGVAELFDLMVRESGFLAHILKMPDVVEKMNKLNGLFSEIRELIEKHKEYGLKEFIQYIDTLQSHNLLIKKSAAGKAIGQVRLMTAHRSKGQEFEHLYIVNAFDGHWGNKRMPDMLKLPTSIYSLANTIEKGDPARLAGASKNDDERRLFYVAITRAKKEVCISYARESIAGKEQLPCMFLQELKPELMTICDSETTEKDFASHREIMFAPRQVSGVDLKDKEFIKELFLRNGLSVTALNNYLRCPWQYFYTNLLRIPKAKSKHQLYGTAIHEALKDFFGKISEGESVNKEYLLTQFKFHLEKQPLKQEEFDESLNKGLKALEGYYNEYSSGWKKNILMEFNVPAVMIADDVRITGKIDKIEIEDGNKVNVVDYKTGKPKTRGEIEGSTQNSNGDIKRQLIFYNLLLNKFEEGKKFKMISADIDFVEPDDKGRYKKEKFIILPEEIQELEETIKKVSKEILNVEFWDKRCDDKDCEFCALREVME